MRSKFRTYSTLAVFIVLISSGQCQFSMSSMLGSMNPSMLSGMNPSMFGSGSSSLMAGMGGMGSMGGMPGMGSMGNFGSSMMMPSMMAMGQAMNDPLMSLAMGSIELNPTEVMILNNLVQTIVGPEASVNPALMVLYSSDGGLPINAAKMIPYITIMQGMAKDLKIKVPGVSGEATKEQIENYIFQRSLMWMQQRNMAGAFIENAGFFLMSNAMNGNSFSSPSSSSSSPASTANTAAATARAAAAARESLAKFIKSQTDKTASTGKSASAGKPAAGSGAASKATTPKPPTFSKEFVAQMIAASNSQPSLPARMPINMPSGMNFPAGMSMPMGMSSGFSLPMSSGEGSTAGGAGMNPSNMMAMEMLGF
ncbi:uncharacterized protein LOC132727131 isoform X1 [Ruditapes philippinarum]|uniref:uncharacterized protein LOC132727131 isoform X1 n=2 Tax=Ruditapes philippinarum TaxID=129788 RepID=UPI00295AE067|nr:uncharacterized protein LOC132727131 isoform X1 [Ruditapes philippinarum]